MVSNILLGIVFATQVSGQKIDNNLLSNSLRFPSPSQYVSMLTTSTPNSICTEKELAYIKNAVKWSNWSWVMLGGNVLSIPLLASENTNIAGAILALTTFTGWTITQGLAAFSYRDLGLSQKKTGSKIPDYGVPRWTHIFAYAFGMGSIAGLSLIWTDETGVAAILTGVCSGLSGIAGIVGNISTYSHSNKVNSMIQGSYLNNSNMSRMLSYDSSKGLNDRRLYVKVPIVTITF